jgi:hypothetical protein
LLLNDVSDRYSQEKDDLGRIGKNIGKTTLFSDLVPVKKRIRTEGGVKLGLAVRARAGIVKTSLTTAHAERATVVGSGAS